MLVEVQRISKSSIKLAFAVAVAALTDGLAIDVNQRAARTATTPTNAIAQNDKPLRGALYDFDLFARLDELKALFGTQRLRIFLDHGIAQFERWLRLLREAADQHAQRAEQKAKDEDELCFASK